MSREGWTYKDIVDFYDRVRNVLDDTTSTSLPDNKIDFPEMAPFAESVIKARVPKWSELSDEKFSIFETIIIYQTASLCQSIVLSKYVKKKQIPTITLEYADKTGFLVNGMSFSDAIDLLVEQLNGETVGSGYVGLRVTKGSGCF